MPHNTQAIYFFLIYRESRVRIKRLKQQKNPASNLNQEKCLSIYILIEYHRQCIYDTTKCEKYKPDVVSWTTKKSLTGKYVPKKKHNYIFMQTLMLQFFLCVCML